jgi:LemA protein
MAAAPILSMLDWPGPLNFAPQRATNSVAAHRREGLSAMTYLVAAIVIAVLFYGVIVFNRLIRERNLVREGWSGVDVQLRRRADLVPALVETVKAYAAHERKLFEDVTAIRSASIAASNVKTQEDAERAMEGALSKLIALKEAYPNLKADQNFLKLQEQLAEIEDHLQMARRYYNGAVRDLNISIQSFPNVLIAGPLGFKEADFFEVDDAGRATPNVTFERTAS